MENTGKKKIWIIGSILYAVAMILVLCLANTEAISAWISAVLRVFRPLLIGLILAYLLNPFFRFFETKMLAKVRPVRFRRVLALILTYLLLFLIFTALILLIVPQLVQSITDFINDSEAYLQRVVAGLNGFIQKVNNTLSQDPASGTGPIPALDPEAIKNGISDFLSKFDLKGLLESMVTVDNIFALIGAAKNAILIVADLIFGFFISLYLLNTKEKRYAQIMRYRKAFFSDKVNAAITRFCTVADRSFGGFLEGKIIDSCIIGVLVYISISLLDVPYAILIATIIGITDIVPIIGPFVGVVPSAVIILLSDPGKLIPFLLCILLIQQLDGNVIAPKILGENTGVSSLCVIIAITTMGALWGLVGMVMGVPLFATVLELTSSYLDKKMEEKGIPNAKKEEEPERGGLFARFKRKALRLQEDVAEGGGGDLSRLEKFQLETYSLAVKYHVFSESSEEALTRFSNEKKVLLNALEATEGEIPNTDASQNREEDTTMDPLQTEDDISLQNEDQNIKETEQHGSTN